MAKKEAEEKVARAIFEKEEVIKALEEEKVDRKASKATIKVEAKEEAVGDILKYGMSFMRSTLFMIKKSTLIWIYPILDLLR